MTPSPSAASIRLAKAILACVAITNESGLSLSVLPNGCVFAIEHQHERGRTLINQVQGSPLDGGIARLYLRIRAPEPAVAEAVGPGAQVSFGATADRFTWDGATAGVRHRSRFGCTRSTSFGYGGSTSRTPARSQWRVMRSSCRTSAWATVASS